MRIWLSMALVGALAVAACSSSSSGSGGTTGGTTSSSTGGTTGASSTGSGGGSGSSGSTGAQVTDECVGCGVNSDCQSGFCTLDDVGNSVCSGRACAQQTDCASPDACYGFRDLGGQDLGQYCFVPGPKCPFGVSVDGGASCDVDGSVPCNEYIHATDGGAELKFSAEEPGGNPGYFTDVVLAAPPAVGTYQGTDAQVLRWAAVAGEGSTSYAEKDGNGNQGTLTLTVTSVAPWGSRWHVQGSIAETLVDVTGTGATTTVSYDLK